VEIPVLIEPVAGNGYVAKTGEPLPLRAEGATEEEALRKLRHDLQARLGNGGRVIGLEIPSSPHPLAEFAGMYSPDDPLVQEWIDIMAENRRLADADPDVP
jgi:predicted RNase H-like HicB family nuclease